MIEQDVEFIQMTIKEWFVYRYSMLLSVLTGPLLILADYLIWKGVYAASGKLIIGGYTFHQMILYIVVSFTIIYITWDESDMEIIRHVRNGSLSAHLLRPYSYLRYAFMHKIGHRMLATFIEFVPVVCIFGIFLGFPQLVPSNMLFFIIALAIAFVMSFLIKIMLGLTAFYLVRPRGIREVYNVLSNFLYGAFLPLTLFPPILQKIFFILPFQFVSFVPTQLFLGHYQLAGLTMSPYEILAYGTFYCIALWLLVAFLWHQATKRYCGVGV